jgi:phosphoribosylformylglycinamidine (FGAM) synthase-like enzyme
MTAIALPTRKRRSRPARVAKGAAKTWTSLKLTKTATKGAKKGAKAFASYKVVKFVSKRGAKLLVIPITVGGGVAAYKKLSSSSDDKPATPYGSSVGPVATPATVTPPKSAPGSDTSLNGEASTTDRPTGSPSTS